MTLLPVCNLLLTMFCVSCDLFLEYGKGDGIPLPCLGYIKGKGIWTRCIDLGFV